MALRISPEPIVRLSARRPWTTIGVWIVVLIIAMGLRVALFDDAITTEFAFTSNPDSKRADELIEDRALRGPEREAALDHHRGMDCGAYHCYGLTSCLI